MGIEENALRFYGNVLQYLNLKYHYCVLMEYLIEPEPELFLFNSPLKIFFGNLQNAGQHYVRFERAYKYQQNVFSTSISIKVKS